jgi:hypothetical protein
MPVTLVGGDEAQPARSINVTATAEDRIHERRGFMTRQARCALLRLRACVRATLSRFPAHRTIQSAEILEHLPQREHVCADHLHIEQVHLVRNLRAVGDAFLGMLTR